jgi:hypothetical protein
MSSSSARGFCRDVLPSLLAFLPLALVPELHHAQPERVPTLATGVHIRTQPERSNRRDMLPRDPAGDWRSTVDIRLAGLLLLLLFFLSGASRLDDFCAPFAD